MQHLYTNAVQNKQEEMHRLLQALSLMTESEKVMKYNQMMNDIIAYKKQLQPQVVLQPPINIPNIPNTPKIRQEVHQSTPWQVRKRPSLLTPPTTVDPANIPLPDSSAVSSSEDQKTTTKKNKWFSYSDDEEEEEERRQYRITHNLRKRLRDDKQYDKFSQMVFEFPAFKGYFPYKSK